MTDKQPIDAQPADIPAVSTSEKSTALTPIKVLSVKKIVEGIVDNSLTKTDAVTAINDHVSHRVQLALQQRDAAHRQHIINIQAQMRKEIAASITKDFAERMRALVLKYTATTSKIKSWQKTRHTLWTWQKQRRTLLHSNFFSCRHATSCNLRCNLLCIGFSWTATNSADFEPRAVWRSRYSQEKYSAGLFPNTSAKHRHLESWRLYARCSTLFWCCHCNYHKDRARSVALCQFTSFTIHDNEALHLLLETWSTRGGGYQDTRVLPGFNHWQRNYSTSSTKPREGPRDAAYGKDVDVTASISVPGSESGGSSSSNAFFWRIGPWCV